MALIDNFTRQELEDIVKNSYTYREVLRKIGYTTFGGNNNKTLQKRLKEYNISVEHFTSTKINPIKRTEENVFCLDSTASQATLRKWFIKGNYISYKCAICGNEGEWNNQPLVLQLDHINGNNSDNRLENLRWVCPNCHSQTNTFCGKQVKKTCLTKEGLSKEIKKNYCVDCGKEISKDAKRCPECAALYSRTIDRPSKEELYNFLIENKGNFSAVGRNYKTSDNNIRKWCKSYNLPYHSSDYK